MSDRTGWVGHDWRPYTRWPIGELALRWLERRGDFIGYERPTLYHYAKSTTQDQRAVAGHPWWLMHYDDVTEMLPSLRKVKA